ncbi:hypothetical protein HELRODRAFT_177632 [Helobdella robusta]|uniref:WSC domain-containing protein n=1 Tax=Helobdella robusta TaxID=6412 RepID=T1FBZ0_HELRO|nr:hypothetical protein HELRODRAFT_177632 [Helobdella robusta]ESN97961.1 hypothetical protein HELRODRAFT_177632 [Helobdella robusta]
MYYTLNIIALYKAADECQCSSREKETCGDPKNYESNCMVACGGNKDQKCGGINCAAKFLVGTYLETPAGQSVYTHCGVEVELKSLSSCDVVCNEGWTGDFCDRRVCGSYKEECGGNMMICNEIQVKGKTFGECVCVVGEYRTAQWTCENLTFSNPAKAVVAGKLVDSAFCLSRNYSFKPSLNPCCKTLPTASLGSSSIFIKKLPSKNLAYRKRVDTIPKLETVSSHYLVDGHIIQNSLSHVLQSADDVLITVHLDALYKVQYVVVYHRPNFRKIGNGNGNQTYVIELDDILLANSLGIPCNTYEVNMTLCAEPPKRVTCKYPEFKSMYVILFPEFKQEINYMAIDEIEVYAGDLREYYYVGCFGSFDTAHTFESKNLTFDGCIKFCEEFRNPMLIVGLSNGDECHCGWSACEESESVNCNLMCSDDNPCGGPDHYIVFSAKLPKPSYVGCYSEGLQQENKLFRVIQGEAFTSCSVHCRTQNSIEFAIKNSVQCICGNLMNASLQVATSQCNQKCRDSATLSCGGESKFSLYKTFSRFEAKSERHFCIDTSAASDCKPGMCDPGWTGPLCNKRDCSLNNGACPKELVCSKVFIGPEITSECHDAMSFAAKFKTTSPRPSKDIGPFMKVLLVLGCFLLLLIISVCCAISYVKKRHPLIYEQKVQAVKEFKAKVGDKLDNSNLIGKVRKHNVKKDTKEKKPNVKKSELKKKSKVKNLESKKDYKAKDSETAESTKDTKAVAPNNAAKTATAPAKAAPNTTASEISSVSDD